VLYGKVVNVNISIVFANILGGREFLGSTYGEVNFGGDVLNKYIEIIAGQNPDLLSIAEVHLDNDTHSEMVEMLAEKLGLPFYDFMGTDKSHLEEGKILGNAILSKYPIVKKDHFIVTSPGIEVDRPNGDHWVMHDKGAQTACIDVGEKTIALTSLHYFPFHHFNRKMNESEFAPQRQKVVDHLGTNDAETIPIITGDFNNKGFVLREAFPELFDAGFSEAIETETTIVGDKQQLDHILYRSSDCTVIDSGVLQIPSDHFAIRATLEI